ncbi:MAG: HAMP domain-containing protein [Pseudomonadota bacterium]|nr:HAMP domain-containing protein [Pseudomonadota bacterium]
MSLTAATVKKWLSLSMAAALFAALLISLLMIADALQNSTRFEHLYSTLLLINALALLALLTLIGLNLRNLIHQVKRGRAGARLTVRLVSLLVILATIPVLIVYYFSLEFLHQRLDNWFDVDIERALTQALDLSRAALDAQMREAFKRAQIVADELNNYQQNGDISIKLNELRDSSGASELTLLTAHGRIIASNSADMGQLLPTRPHDNLLLQLERSDSYISLEPASDNRLHIHVIIRLTHQQQLLHALFPISERISQLANRVEAAFVNYKERAYLHKPLKVSFTLVLSLVLLLSVFGTMWLAFFAARRFVAPLSNLAEGTKAVASGNYEKQLPVTHLDELGFLVHSFNDMTRKIAQARDEVKTSQQLADSQRTYLEAILGRLSSGVIALDYEQRLRMANAAADDILALPMSALLGHTLSQLQDSYPALTPLSRAIYPYLFNNAQDWREEITLFGSSGRKILMCRGTQLQFASLQGQLGGYVIVFDDITTLIQAQRDAAWSEVARRLAHEIKNPLTPIQLSAERLRQKYLPRLSTQEGQTLDRMTHTIIQQVEAMKEMVNTFSNYARAGRSLLTSFSSSGG